MKVRSVRVSAPFVFALPGLFACRYAAENVSGPVLYDAPKLYRRLSAKPPLSFEKPYSAPKRAPADGTLVYFTALFTRNELLRLSLSNGWALRLLPPGWRPVKLSGAR